jgi:uncharacterized membrane protein
MSPFSTGNVLLVTFGDDPENDKNAYQALTDLGEMNSQGQIGMDAGTVIYREVDGRVTVKNQIGNDSLDGTTAGGLIGLLIGVIGGPLGVLVGGYGGLLIGSLFDLDDAETTDSVLAEISKTVRPTRTAVLAEVTEQSPDAVDTAMAKLGGVVTRRPVSDVESELSAAEAASEQAKREARKELRNARVAQRKEDAHEKVEELKAKIHRPKAGAAA